MTSRQDASDNKDNETYSIGQLSKEFDVTPRALRFYEDKGLLSPARDGQTRVYSNRERGRLQLILSGRKVGFSLNDIREILDLYDLGDNQRAQLRQAHKKHKQQIELLEQRRVEIDQAIGALKDGVDWIEARLSNLAPSDDQAEFARAYDQVARRHLLDDDHLVRR